MKFQFWKLQSKSIKINNLICIFSLIAILLSCKNQSVKQSDIHVENDIPVFNKWSNQSECFDKLSEYKPSDEYDYLKFNIYKKKSDSTFFYLTCRYDGFAYLYQFDESVDIESFEDYGEFCTDKNYVYYWYLISDGVRLHRLDTADRPTFKSFGKTIYAKDKNHIYSSIHGIIELADLESFQPISINKKFGNIPFAKDKNNYFLWNEIVEDTVELKKYIKVD